MESGKSEPRKMVFHVVTSKTGNSLVIRKTYFHLKKKKNCI